MVDTLAEDFRTAMTLKVPAGSAGRLSSSSSIGESDNSSLGGSERGVMAPKISIMRLGDGDIGSGGNGAARTTHDSKSLSSYEIAGDERGASSKAAISISSLDNDATESMSAKSGKRIMSFSVEDAEDD